MDDTASLLSVKNCLARFFGSLVYVITLSFLAALLPGALPNVASVIGAVCYVSLVRVWEQCAVRTPLAVCTLSHTQLAGCCAEGCTFLTTCQSSRLSPDSTASTVSITAESDGGMLADMRHAGVCAGRRHPPADGHHGPQAGAAQALPAPGGLGAVDMHRNPGGDRLCL
jgi:hypothetical protein